jgi:hypothetical protein
VGRTERGSAGDQLRLSRPPSSEAQLGGGGGKMNDAVRVDIYVTDIKQWQEVGGRAANSSAAPFRLHARGVRALAAALQLLVELNAIGFIGGGR